MQIANVGLAAELLAHAERHGEVVVGLAGAGQMGSDMVVQLGLMPGIRLGALCEVNVAAARDALALAGACSPSSSARRRAIAAAGAARCTSRT